MLDSSARFDVETPRPGADEAVPFATLSATGGVVDAAAAVRLAAERSAAGGPSMPAGE